MKIIYLIIAHKNPKQVIKLVNKINTGNVCILIHFGKDADDKSFELLVSEFEGEKNIFFIKRYESFWGRGIIEPILEGINVIAQKNLQFDFIVLLSGQDYPIKNRGEISNFFRNNRGKSFVSYVQLPEPTWDKGVNYRWERFFYTSFNPRKNFSSKIKFYFMNFVYNRLILILYGKRKFPTEFIPYGGSAWWCLSKDAIQYIYNFVKENEEFVEFFDYVFLPDEIFFQTILLNSPLKENIVNQSLTYDNWIAGGSHPKILCTEDFDALMTIDALFARKFDAKECQEILDMIDRYHNE